jgi:hypothetical protein
LSLGSSVLDIMFSGNFAEGQTRFATSPREVPPADDDLHSMVLVDNITHMQTAELSNKLFYP